MFIEFVLNNEQAGFERWLVQKRCLHALPMYCFVVNLWSCFICVFEILVLFQKLFDR